MGITLREIIYDIGGGIPDGREFKAVQTGGPSGGCLPKEKLDLPIDYQSLMQAGSIMGSGGMIVMDDKTCMVDLAKFFLNFLRDESCGKCLSCREGTQRMWEIVRNITEGQGKKGDLELLETLAHAVKDASMCGLGQTAANPVLSTLRYFKDEYMVHIEGKKCPALVCREIISAPCQYTCPIEQEASVYIALIAQKRYEEALDIILKDNPLPSVCGRVCDHKCESNCRAREISKPISIRALKRFVMDWAQQNGIRPDEEPETVKKNKKVAIVGAGPSGLAAAYTLNRTGYDVTIFESLPVAGGMLAVGIPEHRLPRKVLKCDIDHILNAGVTLKTDQTLGKDFSIRDLFAQGFDAIYLAIGAHKSMKLRIPNEEASGVMEGTRFLREANLGRDLPSARKVGIIGGGNTAVDAARVWIHQHGTEKVTILYRRTRHEMPAYEEEIEAALEEGIDIQYLVAPVKIMTDNGMVIGVECIRMQLGEMDESGRRRPIPIEGSEFTVELDTLVSAIGERPDLSFIQGGDGLKNTKWDTIVADSKTLLTTCDGVFAGGDVVTGPNTVVDAIAAGKTAANSIDRYLMGKSLDPDYTLCRPSMYVDPVELTEEEIEHAQSPSMPRLPVKARQKNFSEVELGMTEDLAVKEARRCLRCELETKDGKNAIGREK